MHSAVTKQEDRENIRQMSSVFAAASSSATGSAFTTTTTLPPPNPNDHPKRLNKGGTAILEGETFDFHFAIPKASLS